MEQTLLIAGFGGQGVLSAGKFIAEAALNEGRHVSWLPSYGPEMRGGTANCSVIVADHTIGSPILNQTDNLIALNTPSWEKFAPFVRPGGFIVVDQSLVKISEQRQDITVYSIPASEKAALAGNRAFAPVILLGCLIRATGLVTRTSFAQALKSSLPKRHQHLIPLEMELFDYGASFVKSG